jgi:hypothetical protein
MTGKIEPPNGKLYYNRVEITPRPAGPPGEKSIAAILRSIAENGLLTARMTVEKGLVPRSSFSADESADYICVREIKVDPLAGKEAEKAILAETLYDFGRGVLNVMSENNDDYDLKGLFAPRPVFGIIFAARSSRVMPEHDDYDAIIRRGISLQEIDHILVPDTIFETAMQAFSLQADKLIRVSGRRTVDHKVFRFSNIHDFESRVGELLQKYPGEQFWLHGTRLPLPEELQASPPTLSIPSRAIAALHEIIIMELQKKR